MNKRQRAEKLVAALRCLILVPGLLTVAGSMPRALITAAVCFVAAYNVFLGYYIADPIRFARAGRRLSLIVQGIDALIITMTVAWSGETGSLSYLLYWFVLIATGSVSSNVRRLIAAGIMVLVANAVATVIAASGSLGLLSLVALIGVRSAVLIGGLLVSMYIANTRLREELASDRGSYLQAILDCGARLTGFRDVHELAMYVLQKAVDETRTAGGELLLANDETQDLECEAFYSAPGELQSEPPPPPQLRSYANWVIGSRRELLIRHGGLRDEKHPDSPESGDDHRLVDDRAAIAVPLLGQSANSAPDDQSRVLGVLIVWGQPGEDFAGDALDILRIFAAIAGAAMVNLRLYTGLQRSFLATLQSLANGLEARDEYTQGHSERVMRVACAIGGELDVPPEGIDVLRNASLLHDIGKIGVPDAILRKAGRLTAEEWETMRKHPIVSEEICRPLGLPSEVLFLILHHHERLDAKGYPNGLSPREQPLLQRILVVADSFDAMRSRRPYRDSMPIDDLRSEMNRHAGRTLDPTVVEALRLLLDRGELDSVYEEHDRLTAHEEKARPTRQAA